MPPNSAEREFTRLGPIIEEKPTIVAPRKLTIAYTPVLTFTLFHLAGIYGAYLCFTSAKWATLGYAFFTYMLAEIGVTAGAHRLWSHKSFKAKWPLEVLLMVLQSMAYQGPIVNWVRDHRLHHKYSDTDGDPHNARRGFFYSHIGWLLTRKSKDLIQRGRNMDMSDIFNNPIVMFQYRLGKAWILPICFGLPTLVPAYFWGESLFVAWHVNMFRYILNLNGSLLANSFCHMVGYRPYDKNMLSANNLIVNTMILGDGFHNFHHAFPWDYRSAELGNDYFNITTLFIDFFALIGWAYDLKSTPKDIVKARRIRVGDGTDLWGRDDKDLKK